jgi:hypothetical protein
MKGLTWTIGVAVALAALYLMIWPVTVTPVAWNAPIDNGFVVPFESNDSLRSARVYEIGPHEGPEDLTAGSDGISTAQPRAARFCVMALAVLRYLPRPADDHWALRPTPMAVWSSQTPI